MRKRRRAVCEGWRERWRWGGEQRGVNKEREEITGVGEGGRWTNEEGREREGEEGMRIRREDLKSESSDWL